MTTVMPEKMETEAQVVGDDTAVRVEKAAEARKNISSGAFWFVLGVLVTVGTYSAAGPGDTYIVAWGAILFGGLQCARGLVQFVRWG